MAWTIEYATSVRKNLKKLSPDNRKRIRKFLETRLAGLQEPRQLGKALKGSKFENLWRYRVGDHRIIAQIKDQKVTILIVRIGHRKDIYR